jgi:uncharacterized protein
MRRFSLSSVRWLALLLCCGFTSIVHGAPSSTVDLIMSDGVSLSTDIYAVEGELAPVILIRTPYHRSSMQPVAEELRLQFNATIFVQDVRGRGDSGGVDSVFRDDAADGRETLEWIEMLGWSNGMIASWGSSTLATTQMLMAPGAIELYRCQYTTVGTHAIADQLVYRGGVRRRETDDWLLDQDAAGIIGQWDAHPDPADPYWEPVSLTDEKVATIQTSGLHVTGWFDVALQGSVDYFSRIHSGGGVLAQGRQHLLVGPWSHDGSSGELSFPLSGVEESPLPSLENAWRDGCLAQNDVVFDEMPAVYLYVMGATDEEEAPGNSWEAFMEWPPASDKVGLYLRENQLLSINPPLSTQPAATYTHDPQDPVPTLGGSQLSAPTGPFDQAAIESREDVAVFTTEELTAPVEIIGRIHGRLWLSSPTAHSQVVIRLTDVYPDGRSMLIAEGISRFQGIGSFSPVDIDLWSTAMIFNTGHRIRISVSGASAGVFEIAPEYFTAQIGRSSSQPSRLELPLRSGLEGATAPIQGAQTPEPEPQPESEADAGAQVDAGSPADIGPDDSSVATPDQEGETLPPTGVDGFGSDTDEPAPSSGGSSDGCGGGPVPPTWCFGLLPLVLALRSRRRAL